MMQKHEQRGLLDAFASFWSFGGTMPSSWPKENRSQSSVGCFYKKCLVFLEVAIL